MDINQAHKEKVRKLWEVLDTDPAAAVPLLSGLTHWQGPEPIGVHTDAQGIVSHLFEPLRRAFPDLKRETHIFMGGMSSAHENDVGDGEWWVAGTGYYSGQAIAPVFGIPVTGHPVRIRWGEFLRFDAAGQITHAQTIWDFVDWFDQIGLPVLPRPRGAAHVFPAATAYDAVLNDPQDGQSTTQTLDFGRRFIFGGLNSFDETDLSSMGMAQFFHPNVKWYGPGGIGACLSLREFEVFHQQPWLVAFPDRKVMHLESLFAEGRMLAASGPKGVVGTHGGIYLGHEATGNPIEVSGLDFWLMTDTQFTENWVFVDMVHLFSQMGVDLFQRMRDCQS